MTAAFKLIFWLAIVIWGTVQCDELPKHNTHIVHHSLGKADADAQHPATEVGWIPTTDTCGVEFRIPKVGHGSS